MHQEKNKLINNSLFFSFKFEKMKTFFFFFLFSIAQSLIFRV